MRMSYSANPFRADSMIGSHVTVIPLIFNINKSGNKVIQYLISKGCFKNDSFVLDVDDAVTRLQSTWGDWATRQNLKRGIHNLIENDILATSTDPDTYFVNQAYIKQ